MILIKKPKFSAFLAVSILSFLSIFFSPNFASLVVAQNNVTPQVVAKPNMYTDGYSAVTLTSYILYGGYNIENYSARRYTGFTTYFEYEKCDTCEINKVNLDFSFSSGGLKKTIEIKQDRDEFKEWRDFETLAEMQAFSVYYFRSVGYFNDDPNTKFYGHTMRLTTGNIPSGYSYPYRVDKESNPVPHVSLFAEPLFVTYNSPVRIKWSTNNAAYCEASGGWSGKKDTSPGDHYETINNLKSSTNFFLTCTGVSGDSIKLSILVRIDVPSVTIGARPLWVPYGGEATLVWSPKDSVSCMASGGWSGPKAFSKGSHSEVLRNLKKTDVYTITCKGGYGESSQSSIDIEVGPDPGVPKDGGWSDYEWTTCTPTCELRCIERGTRTCTNPAPQNGGKNCLGPNTSVRYNEKPRDECTPTPPELETGGSYFPGGKDDGLVNCTNNCDFYFAIALINDVVDFTFKYLVLPIAAIMFAYAGFQLVISQGGEKKSKAKAIFFDVVIGIATASGAFLIVSTILEIAGRKTGEGWEWFGF